MSELIDEVRWQNNLEKVQRFINQGANVNAVDNNGCTALCWAAYKGNIDFVTMLINAKADVNKSDENDYSPLHRASYYGHVECIRFLIQHGANVNVLDDEGNSPLHFAAWNSRSLTSVQILVTSGAHVDVFDPSGWTALTLAIRFAHAYNISPLMQIAEFLLHAGAKMKNVHPELNVPDWMRRIVETRQTAMSSALVLKGLLKRRLGLSKDAAHLIALYFWSERLK